jgi:hypothetical protein
VIRPTNSRDSRWLRVTAKNLAGETALCPLDVKIATGPPTPQWMTRRKKRGRSRVRMIP